MGYGTKFHMPRTGFRGPRTTFHGATKYYPIPLTKFHGPRTEFRGLRRTFRGTTKSYPIPLTEFHGPRTGFRGPRKKFLGSWKKFPELQKFYKSLIFSKLIQKRVLQRFYRCKFLKGYFTSKSSICLSPIKA
jgi:hypothetical protein